MRFARLLLLVFLAFASSPARAQTSYPMLTRIEPTAVRRGETVELAISGVSSFEGASQLLCEPSGLSGSVLSVETAAAKPGRRARKPQATVKASLTVSRDAPLGPREIRVATPQGISSVGLVVVVDDPVVVEADDKANDVPALAQPLTLPVVATGVIRKVEDIDWYAIDATAGQKVTFRVWANQLENKIHDLQTHFDPILAIYDSQGRELAVDDNHDFADPRLTYQFRETGTYRIQLRDTTYAGNPNWTYVLEITAGPFATSVMPMAVNPGAKATLHASGVNFDPAQAIALDVPKDLVPGPHRFSLATAQGATLSVPLVVTPLPIATEAGDSPETTVRGQEITLPVALSGSLAEANDVDAFRFQAKKGQTYVFDVFARRAGSAADPVVRIINLKDELQAEADDGTLTKDPRIQWTAPADGHFAVVVTDLHSRGGDEFGYLVEASVATPDFVITSDPDKINVGPGGRIPFFVLLTRRGGFTGPVSINWDGLPPGVTASPLTIPPSMTYGLSVISAAADAKPLAALISITGRGDSPEGPVIRPLAPSQEIYVPGGGRAVYPVETLALGITEPSDIQVEATPAAITLAPGGTATIDVTVVRDEGYDKGVNLAIAFQHLGSIFGNPLPPGVTVKDAGSKTLLGPKETKGKIILEAAATAPPCENVPIAVMGHVSINFVVKTSYASKPILVTVPAKK